MYRTNAVRFVSTAGIALGILAVLACSENSEDFAAPAVTHPTDSPAQDLSLDSREYPTELRIGSTILALDPTESGERSSDEVINESFDPEDERADYERFGVVDSYVNIYSTVDSASPIFWAATGATRLRGPSDALAYFADEFADATASLDHTNSDGTRLVAVEDFNPPEPQNSRGAVLALVTQSGTPFYMTLVSFAQADMVGYAAIFSYNSDDFQPDAGRLASELQAVLGAG